MKAEMKMKVHKIRAVARNLRFRQELTIRGFWNSDAGHSFLNKQDNNDWSVYEGPLRPGKYSFVGGEWRNVRDIPIELKAHL